MIYDCMYVKDFSYLLNMVSIWVCYKSCHCFVSDIICLC